MDVISWVRLIVGVRPRTMSALVSSEIFCIHSHSLTLETNARRYFREEKEDQQVPGALKSPAISLGTGWSAAALSASISGNNSDWFH